MKTPTMRAIVTCAFLAMAGCAHTPHPVFDASYLPGGVPGAPQQRIDLSSALEKKRGAGRKGLFGSSSEAPPAALTWIAQDSLLFTVLTSEKHGRDSWLYSFLISPATGEVRLLDDAEQDAVRKTIERTAPGEEKSSLAEFGRFVVQAAVAVVTGGRAAGSGSSGGSSRYDGTIENNGYVLTMNAGVRGSRWTFSPAHLWRYTVKNTRTGRSFKGKYRTGRHPEKAFERWLRSWRISPDGRYYLIGQTATLIDAESRKASARIMQDYPYAGLDVSPAWDRIALLMMEPDETTGRMKCWIEFYSFAYGKAPGKT